MEFRTVYDRKIVSSEEGSPLRTIYEAVYDKNKNIVITEKGTEDFSAYINSFADSVNIHVLLARFMNGDKEALLQRAGAYIDISSLPTNINEFIELSRNAENLFNTLPKAVKEKFNNNLVEFISTIGDKEWIEKMDTSEFNEQIKVVEDSKQRTKEYKNAVKNSVYGDQPTEQPTDVVPEKNVFVNPLTGKEFVNE